MPVQDDKGKPLSIIIWNNSRALCDKCLTDFKGKYSTEQDKPTTAIVVVVDRRIRWINSRCLITISIQNSQKKWERR